mgnify:FL=1
MAPGFFRSKESYPAGIPLAFRRAFHRSAQSNPACREKGLLTFVQKGEIFSSLMGQKKTLLMGYPHNNGTAGRLGDNDFHFSQVTVCVWKTQRFS